MDIPNIGVWFERFHFSLYLIWQQLGSIPTAPKLSSALFPSKIQKSIIVHFSFIVFHSTFYS